MRLPRLLRVLAAAFASLAIAEAAAAQSDDELEELRERIQRSRSLVEQHEAQERDVFERIEEIDQRLEQLAASVRGARADAERASAALDEIEVESERLAGELERTRAAMARRAVALYKTGDVGPLRILFDAGSLRELLQRVSALRELLAYDAGLVARFERDRSAYAAARSDAAKAAERHRVAAEKLRGEQRALQGEQVAKRTLLERVREDRKNERQLLVELERAARALEATLQELGGAGRRHADWLDGSGFAGRRGALPPPVDAPLAARFGRVVDEDFLTQTVRNGVVFAARQGARVRAAANAEVRFAGWFRGYGKIVILDHGDAYFTVSGHLSEIHVEVGDRVREGETIGAAGDTGSLEGPRLYFELRRGGEAVDPLPWLSQERLAEAR